MNAENQPLPPVAPRLGLWDIVSVIIGIVVGTAIFRSSTAVFQNVSGTAVALGVWLLGGIVSWWAPVNSQFGIPFAISSVTTVFEVPW